jgi:hypothetical protein
MSHDSTLLLLFDGAVFVFHRYRKQLMIFTFLLEHTTSVKVSVRFVVLLFFITVP